MGLRFISTQIAENMDFCLDNNNKFTRFNPYDSDNKGYQTTNNRTAIM